MNVWKRQAFTGGMSLRSVFASCMHRTYTAMILMH